MQHEKEKEKGRKDGGRRGAIAAACNRICGRLSFHVLADAALQLKVVAVKCRQPSPIRGPSGSPDGSRNDANRVRKLSV